MGPCVRGTCGSFTKTNMWEPLNDGALWGDLWKLQHVGAPKLWGPVGGACGSFNMWEPLNCGALCVCVGGGNCAALLLSVPPTSGGHRAWNHPNYQPVQLQE